MSEIYNKYLPQADRAQLVERIRSWNVSRNGLVFDEALEVSMLTEELQELFAATNLANQMKEYADIAFVGFGTVAKDTDRVLYEFVSSVGDIAYNYVRWMKPTPQISDTYPKFTNVLLAIVTEANEAKGTEKDASGKVKKGPNYVNPEHTIQKMLEEMRIGF